MQQQVTDAAFALVRPSTDSNTRRAASQFLENWNGSFEAWDGYCHWISSFCKNSESNLHPNAIGIQLLCFQLLQSKIRKEVSRSISVTAFPPVLASIQSALATYLHSPLIPKAVATSACVSLAALSIRTGQLHTLLESCCHLQPSPSVALRLLANIPLEIEACADAPPSQLSAELQPYIVSVLDTIRDTMITQDPNVSKDEAAQALKQWVTIGRVTLSMLDASSPKNPSSLLVVLLQLLSSPTTTDEKILVQSCQVLSEALLLPTDSCTDTRQAACSVVLECLGQVGAAPLQHATQMEWEDACHAFATFICTFVTEEVDALVSLPAEPLLTLLLHIQSHPLAKVRIAVLECWLTVQEIPVKDRHQNWRAPLFNQVVQCLLEQSAYPSRFVSWEAEVALDQSEFDEFRQMVKDVLISSYFLLRSSFVQNLVQVSITAEDWATKEVAMFGLVAPAREICARVRSNPKAPPTTPILAQDRATTSEQLFQLIQFLMTTIEQQVNGNSSNNCHRLFLERAAEFVGALAPAWASTGSAELLQRLIQFLRAVMVLLWQRRSADSVEHSVIVAAKAIRSLLISCGQVLVSSPNYFVPLRESLLTVMDTALSTQFEDVMIAVSEGCTRVLVQCSSEKENAISDIVGPVIHQARALLAQLPMECTAYPEEAVLAADSLQKLLHVIQVIIRFCDAPTSQKTIEGVILHVFPLLEEARQKRLSNSVVDMILSIHQQMLKASPQSIQAHLEQTVQYVLTIFETTQQPSSLAYLSCAVEQFGSTTKDSFGGLFGHVSTEVFSLLHADPSVYQTELIAAYFEFVQRCLLFCPAALLQSTQLTPLVACAAECISASEGAQSSRAALNFLSQLFGWRFLRLSAEALKLLQSVSYLIDREKESYGAKIIQSCVAILVGGPQSLWPASADCIFSTLSSILVPENENNKAGPENLALAQRWLEQAAPVNNEKALQIYPNVIKILLRLLQQGVQRKAKTKMLLTDFSKIHKGEMTTDVLLAYSL